MRMFDEDEIGLKEKPDYTRYIKNITSKIRPEAPEVRANDLIPKFAIIGIEDSGKVEVHHT